MKPNFALDLSHEGISLLHRSKGGWTLVGEVSLDDPDMGGKLTALRQAAAEIESSGFATKLIIPNSQILYTKVEAKGPDDIAREVQIRSGLDGLTPYSVGDLVFDWRADGDQARVAVLARETMDEAEAFAIEYQLNPVSFAARPEGKEFSGEPFFGKTKAASRILGAGERVVPDASPVPHRPRAMALAAESRVDAPAAPLAPTADTGAPDTEFSWADVPASQKAEPSRPVAPAEDFTAPSPDPFAVFDAPEVSAPSVDEPLQVDDESPAADTAPSEPESGPVLAPFPPTSDEDASLPPPPKKPRAKRRKRQKAKTEAASQPKAETAPKAAAGDQSDSKSATAPVSPPTPQSSLATSLPPVKDTPAAPVTPAASDTDQPAPPAKSEPRLTLGATDRVDPAPGSTVAAPVKPTKAPASDLAFSSRRAADADTDDTAPADRVAGVKPRIGIPGAAPDRPATAPLPPGTSPKIDTGPTAIPPLRTPPAHVDRIRAEMAEALARPLPGPTKSSEDGAEKPARGDRPGVGAATKIAKTAGSGLLSGAGAVRDRVAAQREKRADRAAEAKAAATPVENKTPSATPEPKPAKKRRGLFTRARPEADDDKRAAEAEALTVFGARKSQDQNNTPRYLGLVLTLILLLLMAIVAVWSSFFMGDGEVALFNPAPEVTPLSEPDQPVQSEPTPVTPADPVTQEPDVPPVPSTAEVLTPEAAETRYAATGVWQRAPENLPEPGTTRLENIDITALGAPGSTRSSSTELPASDGIAPEPLPGEPLAPPPPGTSFDLDENGLVRATPEGAVSPAGILVYSGRPPLVPPVRPGTVAETPAEPEPAPEPVVGPEPEPAPDTPAEPETPPAPAPDAVAPEPAVVQPDIPRVRPPARPAGLVPENAAVEPDPVDPATDTAALGPEARPDTATPTIPDAAIDTVVEEVIEAAFAGASELAVATSRQPTHRPSNFAKIVDTALASASDGSSVVAAVAAAPATTSPAIPTSANVATRATMENALNLRKVNLIGIYGTSNARRALVRMSNGRYVKVEVGDRLDGGRVTSITSSRLTYQKGSRNYALDVLPLG